MELLDEMRAFGNIGKHAALEILDMNKDHEQYYLDAFGNRISLNGNRRLKKPFTELHLADIHKQEIARCSTDLHYFKDNYIQIKTKNGVNFPDMRKYQNDFLEEILPDDNEDNIGLMGRQSGKSISTGIYLTHKFVFGSDLNIGIVANKGSMAREFLSNVKNMFIELPIWMQTGIAVWNKGSIETETKMRILTDVPTSDAFRGFTIAILVVDECAFIKPTVWEEFSDSIFPSQSGLAWKKNIILSTANGMNHFYDMVKGARANTNGMNIFEVDWRDVPRYRPDGTQMEPEEFKKKIIAKHGDVYFEQNYGNNFMGSSHTLVSASKLNSLIHDEPEEIRDGKLKVYQKPIKGNKYIMTVDAAKDGLDSFAVQVIDITTFHFKQVATAQLQIDYLLMPEFIYDWCQYYNNPYLIIENNEGAGQSIADQLYQSYEYANMHFDTRTDGASTSLAKARKKYPGFRTTIKTRKQILATLRLFLENDKLDVVDKSTIQEFYTFILVNGKYQADDGYHDDMIMSLAMVFAPFMSYKNFEDMGEAVKALYSEEDAETNITDHLAIGDFDDGTDEEYLSDSSNGFDDYDYGISEFG